MITTSYIMKKNYRHNIDEDDDDGDYDKDDESDHDKSNSDDYDDSRK